LLRARETAGKLHLIRLEAMMNTSVACHSVRAHLFCLCVVPLNMIVFSGCAGAPTPGSGETRPVGGSRLSSTTITQEEIRTAGAANAYDLVQSLRPRWLNKRGPQTLTDTKLAAPPTEGDIIVYMSTAKLGGLNALREVPASSLVSIEFLDAPKANYKFGRGHPYGAILLHVTSK
jgi:hypothetical protein